MYEGEVSDVPTFFEARGHPVPPHYNPADWIMNVAQAVLVKELARRGYFPSDTRPWTKTEALFVDEEEGRNTLGITDHQHYGEGISAKDNEKRIGFITQASMLFKRELRNIARNRKPLVARFAFSFIMSILVGILFLGIGGEGSEDFRVVQAHFGALVLVLMMSMFGTAMPSLLAFPEERPVFLREYSTDHYSVAAYFVSRLTTEAIVTFPQMLLSTTLTYLLIDLQMPFGYLLAVVYTLAMTSTAVAVLLGETSVVNRSLRPIFRLVYSTLFTLTLTSNDFSLRKSLRSQDALLKIPRWLLSFCLSYLYHSFSLPASLLPVSSSQSGFDGPNIFAA